MRYDVEIVAAQTFTGFLQAVASTQPGQLLDPTACPIVNFFDPMDVDDADRVTVDVENADTDDTDSGRFEADVSIGVKTLWHQPSIGADMLLHFARLNDVRDKLMTANLVTLLAAYAPAGVVIDAVEHKKRLKSGKFKMFWFSQTIVTVKGFFAAGT